MNERPVAIDATWQQGRVLVIGRHDYAEAFEAPEI
jgi:hypothetical protein